MELEPALQTVDRLYDDPVFSVDAFDCRRCAGHPAADEFNERDEIVFPRAGVFVVESSLGRIVADPNHVVFFNHGDAFRIRHPIEGGDASTIVSVRSDALRSLLDAVDPAIADRETLFAAIGRPTSARVGLLHARLLSALRSNAATRLEIEERLTELIAAVFDPGATPRFEGQRRCDVVDRVQILLGERFAERLSLEEIGRRVYCSPFHLARLFRRQTGSSIHAYRTRLRLRAASERLADGGGDLTELALDLGFSSHSHFSTAFRREFGFNPSMVRKARF